MIHSVLVNATSTCTCITSVKTTSLRTLMNSLDTLLEQNEQVHTCFIFNDFNRAHPYLQNFVLTSTQRKFHLKTEHFSDFRDAPYFFFSVEDESRNKLSNTLLELYNNKMFYRAEFSVINIHFHWIPPFLFQFRAFSSSFHPCHPSSFYYSPERVHVKSAVIQFNFPFIFLSNFCSCIMFSLN